MGAYKKKPVVIEARQLGIDYDEDCAIVRWCGGVAIGEGEAPETQQGAIVRVPTLEGDHYAKPGDFIIRGVKGEFYPCKPDIFAATYEPAEPVAEEQEPETGYVVEGYYVTHMKAYGATLEEAIQKYRERHGAHVPDDWEKIGSSEPADCGAFVGACESCGKLLQEGDKYARDDDGIRQCAACCAAEAAS